ncbi:MAG: Asp-tRNA(Asn)/Glu-tRNA(Gln) amidotransferase subunit GatA [Verrucomicrobia bacterium]|nr:Asp-tRNA(Asn)/Glu-tRNA(Gln) amidotransferase subunit GatA [Verrucomicrobiota bacterium]MBV8486182.1 Asp-tRNA(Asn)/Glu-tRNA(Gln) amidotransferase subunit GatA [Verrucomicrobiota bacterium]
MALSSLTVYEAQDLLRRKEISPKEIVEDLVRRIEQVDGAVHGYLSFDPERALKDAEQADVSLPLGGIPISIKDVVSVQGHPCGCASKILQGYVAPFDATVIKKLRAAGAIPFGRTNMDEFAMGSSTENSAFGPSRNPWDPDRIPGGSSGGSSAVVAADEALAALGSDTGGSIRQPAALCGCVGLKPTYGRVSRYGLVAFASSLDQIGPLTKDVRDAAMIMNVISGVDPCDSTTLDELVPDYTADLDKGVKSLTLGLPKEYFIKGLDPQVEEAVRAAVGRYEKLGAKIVDISLPHTEYALSTYYIIAPAEASANLARFDGVRYGFRADGITGLLDHYGKTREEGFGQEVKRRIILGTYALSSGYYDAYYLRAQKVRTLIRRDFDDAFAKVDAILCPTSPTPAFKLGERTGDPLQMYLADVFTLAANMAGICGISIPCGFAEVEGMKLPIGLQILGKALNEATILRVANAYEQSTDWHLARPPLGWPS